MSPTFNDPVELQDSANNPTVRLDGDDASIRAGQNAKDGLLVINDGTSNTIFSVNASTGFVEICNPGGNGQITLEAAGGIIRANRQSGGASREVFRFDSGTASLTIGDQNVPGDLVVRDGAGNLVLEFHSGSATLYIGATGSEGDLKVRDSSGREVFRVDGSHAAAYIGAEGNEGDLYIEDSAGRRVFRLDGENADLYVGAEGNEGDITVRDASGRDVFHLNGKNAVLVSALKATKVISSCATVAGKPY